MIHVRRPKIRLGDAVAVVAKPIARAIDAATSHTSRPTNLANCSACAKRQARLNGESQILTPQQNNPKFLP